MYDDRVKQLRYCADSDNQCSECKYRGGSPDGSKMCFDLLMVDAAEAIEKLNKRIDFLMNCIYEAEDSLDRGADNDWARAALEKAERGQNDV